jgi:hypothetical protein
VRRMLEHEREHITQLSELIEAYQRQSTNQAKQQSDESAK